MPRFAADGLQLAYETYGEGDPVVLVHGFTSHGYDWVRDGWVGALDAAGLRALTLDLPGHGASAAPPDAERVATARLARDVVALLDDAGLERAALVGFSLGGGVVLQAALDHPKRVTRLVVGGVGDDALDELHDPRDIQALATNPRVTDLERLRPYFAQPGWPGGVAALRPLPVPVLVFVAGRDEYMPRVGELLRRLQPARVLDAPTCGHHTVLRDEEVRREAVAFLRESA